MYDIDKVLSATRHQVEKEVVCKFDRLKLCKTRKTVLLTFKYFIILVVYSDAIYQIFCAVLESENDCIYVKLTGGTINQ